VPDAHPAAVLVVGLGNELRHDDGAGIMAARELLAHASRPGIEVREQPGEPIGLLDALRGRHAAVLIDAMTSGAVPGTIARFDAGDEPLLETLRCSSSTHAVSLTDALELARALGRLPSRLIIYAVEGRDFSTGAGLSAGVRGALPDLIEAVMAEACRLRDELAIAPS
jgi:hydrogenase maturation protease